MIGESKEMRNTMYMTLVQDPQHEANEEDYEEGGGEM
jgi:hypothetical protein